MDVPIGERWQSFVATAVETGRYVSASDVVTEGLRLLQEREERLLVLREMIEESIARGGSHTDDEVAAAVEAALEEIDAAEAQR